MNPTQPRGIFFDLDDTLIRYSESERSALAAGCRLAEQIYPRIQARALAAAIYEVYATLYCYGTEGYSALATLSVEEFRWRLTTEALTILGIDDPALTGTLVDAYRVAERAALTAYPDVVETLRLLRPHFHLGIITNGPSATQREKIATLALDGFFDEIVVDTEFGHPKPDPRIFAHAADRIHLSPSELIFVGNSLEADTEGARMSGWTSVWMNIDDLPLPCGTAEPDYRITSFSQLPYLPPIRYALKQGHTLKMATAR